MCSISSAAVSGAEGPKTIRLQGTIQKKEVLMLVDSGSSHSFVSSAFAVHLMGVQQSRTSTQVRVANGGILSCDQEISRCKWMVQGVQFCSDLKVLDLKCYDVVLEWIG